MNKTSSQLTAFASLLFSSFVYAAGGGGAIPDPGAMQGKRFHIISLDTKLG